MADLEKRALEVAVPVSGSPSESVNFEKPKGWKYKSFTIGSLRLPWYASPPSQLLLVSFVCFLCPGMFNALSGMGGGGQFNPSTADNANVALYSTFSVVGFFAGSFTNVLGVRVALSFGGLGYCIYIASFLSYNNNQNEGFCIFAGALLGVCAGLLWNAQGLIMMSYPPESSKGRYISWFWMIFNLGGVIGSLIPLGQNIHVKTASSVTNGTYIGFLVLTFLGALLAFTLVSARAILRSDGSHVIVMKNPSWRSEIWGLFETMKIDPAILLMFPMFWSSNWFTTYQFNDVNAARFDVRTRALNSTLYWISQIIGAFMFGYCLDVSRFRRSTRARGAWVALFVLTMVIWGGGYAWQKGYSRQHVPQFFDWTSDGYVGPMFLFMFYGFYDAAWQTCVYWYMGAMTNNGRMLANYAGFYKGIQSAGAAVAWRLDGLKTPYMTEFTSNWALLSGSLIIVLPLILLKIKDHVPIEEDLKFCDAAFEEVAPQTQQVETVSK